MQCKNETTSRYLSKKPDDLTCIKTSIIILNKGTIIYLKIKYIVTFIIYPK